jgi:hypothetical protein
LYQLFGKLYAPFQLPADSPTLFKISVGDTTGKQPNLPSKHTALQLKCSSCTIDFNYTQFNLFVYRCLLVALVFSAASTLYAQPTGYLIRAGKFFDSEKGAFKRNMVILVHGVLVDTVKEEKDITDDDRHHYPNVIDLSAYTVMPGLIDSHTHMPLGQATKHVLIGYVEKGMSIAAALQTATVNAVRISMSY